MNGLNDRIAVAYLLQEASGIRSPLIGTSVLSDVSTVGSAAGLLGMAADFEADQSECLTCADNAELSIGDNSFTVHAVIKPESVSGGNFTIASKASAATTANYEWIFQITGTSKLTYRVSSGAAAAQVTGSTTLVAGTRYFVAGVHDKVAQTINVFLNGVADATAVSHTASCWDSTKIFSIGSINGTLATYDGLMEQFVLWKGRALTAAELLLIRNGGSGRPLPFPTYASLERRTRGVGRGILVGAR